MVNGSGELKVHARWTAKQYTLKLNVNKGNALAAGKRSKTVTFDAKLGKLPVPKRLGYVFKGWYTAKSGGKRVSAATVYGLASGRTLYAHWAKVGTVAAGKKAAAPVKRIA
ncbi:MAG: InlB B-repeat-containing protein [Clostridiales Family XIII bacterium]|nr:InlB B-repeat-containing protein [Clostridiales Family XIII bacterium]